MYLNTEWSFDECSEAHLGIRHCQMLGNIKGNGIDHSVKPNNTPIISSS